MRRSGPPQPLLLLTRNVLVVCFVLLDAARTTLELRGKSDAGTLVGRSDAGTLVGRLVAETRPAGLWLELGRQVLRSNTAVIFQAWPKIASSKMFVFP